METTVLHKYGQTSGKPLVQLSSSFTLEPDGYLRVPIEFLVTPNGLSAGSKAIDSILPKPGQKLSESLYSVKNLPSHRGLFVKTATLYHRNGLHIAEIECTSCLSKAQTVLEVSRATRSFSAVYYEPRIIEENGEEKLIYIDRYFSFKSKIPTVVLKTCCLVGETPEQNTSVEIANTVIYNGGQMNVIVPIGERSRGAQYQWTVTDIINRRWANRSKNKWSRVESDSIESDGSVVRFASTYTVEMIQEPNPQENE